MKLLQIPPDMTARVWGAVEPMLARSIDMSRGTQTIHTVKERLVSNHAQLWTVVEDAKPHTIHAAAVTSIVDYPAGRRALMIEFLGGRDMATWNEFRDDIEKWAAGNGCDLSFCWIRKGLVKYLPDYKLSHYVMMKDIAA